MEWKSGSGRSLSSPAFEEEIRGYLQLRLRMLAGGVTLLLWVLSLTFIISLIINHGSWTRQLFRFFTQFPNAILAAMAVSTALVYGILKRGRLSSRALAILDALFLQVLVIPCLVLYDRLHFFSFSGFPFVVPFLILFILTRAVLVPSSWLRTVILSLPAALGVFLIQLQHGQSLYLPGEAYPASYFTDMLIQNQVCLLGAITVAAAASRVNMGLRRRTFDARKVGQYDLVKQIGAGAMGEVHLATHSLLKRPTAIKFLHPEITGAATLRRFEQEVRQTSRLSHPNTISIFDYGHTADGVFYYAMEFLRGADLKRIVESTGPMPPSRVIGILIQACSALHEAHGKGLVHRDIKPANIMLCEQGAEFDVVKVVDFGLVRDIRAESSQRDSPMTVAGTPQTMAPETLRGDPATPLSDLYSLGVVGYFLLTGEPIFDASTTTEFLQAHQHSAPVPMARRRSGIPADLEAVISGCLGKDPARRPQSASALRSLLYECASAGVWTQSQARAWWQEHEQEILQEPATVHSDPDSQSGERTLVADSSVTRIGGFGSHTDS